MRHTEMTLQHLRGFAQNLEGYARMLKEVRMGVRSDCEKYFDFAGGEAQEKLRVFLQISAENIGQEEERLLACSAMIDRLCLTYEETTEDMLSADALKIRSGRDE